MSAAPPGRTARDALLSRLCGQVWPFGPLLDALPLSRSARVLDIGGGEGGLLAELAQRGHAGRRELADVTSGTDAHTLPYSDGSFDAVFMLRVLAHLHTPALALAEAWRVLAPGGSLVVAAHGPGHLAGVLPPGRPVTAPMLPGIPARSFEVFCPVEVSVAEWRALAAGSGQPVEPADSAPSRLVRSGLQLVGWVSVSAVSARTTESGRG